MILKMFRQSLNGGIIIPTTVPIRIKSYEQSAVVRCSSPWQHYDAGAAVSIVILVVVSHQVIIMLIVMLSQTYQQLLLGDETTMLCVLPLNQPSASCLSRVQKDCRTSIIA